MRPLLRDRRGAVYVEFLAAFLPLLFFHFALVQYAFIVQADLITKHAALLAARAAIVVLHDDPAEYDGVPVGRVQGKRKDDIERAARIPLSTMGFNLASVKVVMNDAYARDELVTVRVEYDFHCRIPMARSVLCGFLTNRKKLVGEASLPNQGADYRYPE